MRVTPPIRVFHSYALRLHAPPEEVFPLLCPVREVDWVADWSPDIVLSDSGFAEIDCIFTTIDDFREAIWIITEHDLAAGRVEMVKVVPGFAVTRLRIRLAAAGARETTAEVAYMYTALSGAGEAFVATRTIEVYEQFMRDWERSMNRYLEGAREAGRDPAP